MKRRIGKSSLALLRAIAKNPYIDRGALRHIYGYGDYIKALKKLEVIQLDGKWILDADLLDYVASKEPAPKPADVVPPRQVNVLNRKPFVMPAIAPLRAGAMDYQQIKSKYAA